jgi:hypothetical protein
MYLMILEALSPLKFGSAYPNSQQAKKRLGPQIANPRTATFAEGQLF